MLDGVRNNLLRGWPLIIIISVCALPFVFLGTGSLGTVFGSNYGSVNGEQVEEIDIQVAQNRVIQNYRDIFGDDFDFGILPQDQQAQAINNEIIRQKVLLAEVRSLGLINKEEINSAKKEIIRNQDFYVDGNFDEGRFEAFVNANGFTKDAFIEMLTRIEATNKYTQSITSNFTTDEEVKDFIKLIEKTVDVTFIKVSYEDILNSVSSSLEEQTDYYLNNKDSFLSDEKRSLKYFKLSNIDFIDSINIPEDYYEQAYEAYVQEVNNSKQKRISHIMIDKINYDDESEALSAINAINEKLINGDNFEELAKEYSEDLLTKDSGGDLDYFSPDLFPDEFANEVDNLSLNQISSVINLDTSIHILKVTEIYQDELLSFDEKRLALEEDLIEAESSAILNEEYFKILDLIDSNSKDEQSVSKDLTKGLELRGFDLINSNIRLKEYSNVQNTYISIFSVLGGLGVLVGTLGVGIIIARSVLERRSELSVMRAIGFNKSKIKKIILYEHLFLVSIGIIIGVVSSIITISPSSLSTSQQVPIKLLLTMTLSIVIGSFIFCYLATQLTIKGKLLEGIKTEWNYWDYHLFFYH